jgi:hypothetical protein
MGCDVAVRFALDDPEPGDQGQARRGRKAGHHARTAGDQACLDAFAAMLRGDELAAARYLSRLDPEVLSGRLVPALRALQQAADKLAGPRG